VIEPVSHAFIVRIMIEPGEPSEDPGEWKGMIQHAVSGDYRFFRGVQAVPELIIQLLRTVPIEGKNPPYRNLDMNS
jgi:hypothetical protein